MNTFNILKRETENCRQIREIPEVEESLLQWNLLQLNCLPYLVPHDCPGKRNSNSLVVHTCSQVQPPLRHYKSFHTSFALFYAADIKIKPGEKYVAIQS